MKLIAKYNVQVRGHIYTKGEAMEWDGPLTPRLIANFTEADGSSLFVGQTDEKRGPIGDKGALGDKGTPGELPLDPPLPLDGEQGDPGPKGEKGNMGDKGEQGQQGTIGPLDPPPPEAVDEDALIKRTLDVLKREGVMRQLDEMGVTYQANAKGTFLARLLLMSKGEIKCSE